MFVRKVTLGAYVKRKESRHRTKAPCGALWLVAILMSPTERECTVSLKEFKSRTIAAGGNAKTVKGDGVYQTAIMYLAPHTASLVGNTCPMAITAQCHVACLYGAGRAEFLPSIPKARIAKTERYFRNRSAFMAELVRDLSRFVKHCAKQDVKPACRLNGTSDIQYEVAHPCERNGQRFESIFAAFPEVTFYDYTKIYKRAYRALPANYSLTVSYSGANPAYADAVMKAHRETGVNVATVFRSKQARNALIAAGWNGLRVINGDETDMRFLDDKGVVIGLYAKGKAGRADRSGFVVDIAA